MDQAKQKISNQVTSKPVLGILHILTNAVKTKDPSTCLREIQSLVDDIQKKWESTLCIILLATPRTDDVKHHTNGQIINAMLRQSFSESSNIFSVDHSNMCNSGMPVAEFLAEDGFHLSERGTSQLAGNIKRAIHTALQIPFPYREV